MKNNHNTRLAGGLARRGGGILHVGCRILDLRAYKLHNLSHVWAEGPTFAPSMQNHVAAITPKRKDAPRRRHDVFVTTPPEIAIFPNHLIWRKVKSELRILSHKSTFFSARRTPAGRASP